MRNKQGFTLMELMVVIAIVGILSGIAIPNFLRFMRESSARSDIRQVAAVIQKAKLSAAKKNLRSVIVYDVVNNSYQAFIDSGGGCGNALAFDNLCGDEVIEFVEVKEGSNLYTNLLLNSFAFNSRGMPENLPTVGDLAGQTVENRTPAVFVQSSANRFFRCRIGYNGNIAVEEGTNGDNWN